MKFVFFGTPEVAQKTLATLLAAGHTPVLVVTNPDAPKGRGRVLTQSPVSVLAQAHGIPVMTPEKLTTVAVEAIAECGAELGICVAYGKILPDALIAAFPNGIINVHYSLLPRWRGATPLEAALRAGDTETGVTIQQITHELDAGDILMQETVPIEASDTARTLRPKLIELGASMLLELLPQCAAGAPEHHPQDHSHATHCGKLVKQDGLIALNDDTGKLWNTYRAFNDSIGTYTFFRRGEKTLRVQLIDATYERGAFAPRVVRPEGKSDMPYADFLRSGATPLSAEDLPKQ